MIHTFSKGKTLLVDGPSCIQLLSGKISILGASVKAGEKLVVRKGKRLPLEASSNVEIQLALGDSASCAEIDGSAIPASWRDAVDKILSSDKYRKILVIGGIDSGKTGFCTYMANRAVGSKRKVAIIDGDLGQSEIGAPGTVGLCSIQASVTDLFNLQPEGVAFVGATSPCGMVDATMGAFAALKAEASTLGADFLVVNTDGWVEGDGAVDYKLRLVKNIEPDIVLAIQSGNEMCPILDGLKDVEVSVIEAPKNVKRRDGETRKVLRESAYKKHLKGTKIRSIPLSWVKIEGNLKDSATSDYLLKKKIEDIVGKKVLNCRETATHICCVLEMGRRLVKEELKKLETELGKQVDILKEGVEEGLLVALENAHGKFLGIGTMCSMDFQRGTIKINTPVDETVAKIYMSQIRLDREGNEIDAGAQMP